MVLQGPEGDGRMGVALRRRRWAGFLREYVILLGFLSGLSMAIGFDLQAAIWKGAGEALEAALGVAGISTLFLVLPTLLLAYSVWKAYRRGGLVGLAAVLCGFLGGLLLFTRPWEAVVFVGISVLLSIVAVEKRIYL
ncbi:MAG: hypothetical protein LUQ58_01200 [Methanomicrobiales archaeon]|nr:hypothetical protein [Methanomicrobiales archaeon]